MKRHSDLAVEHFGFAAPEHAEPVSESVREGYSVLHAVLPDGQYHTILSGKIWLSSAEERRRLLRLTAGLLREMMGETERILVAGIGNPDIPSDALGACVCRRMLVTGDMSGSLPALFSIQPGTASRTGIDTAVFIRCIADEIRPDLIIAVDALAAKSRERLQTVIQLSDSGLKPGSALAHTAGEISGRTMPCPVISIGVPTVISTASLSGEDDPEPLLVTRAESDVITECYASILSGAIHAAIFGQ